MITLWGRNNSTNVKKVRWVLAELGLPYQHIMAGLEFGLNHDPEYLAMNPNGLVPLLKDDAMISSFGNRMHYSLSGRRVWTGPFMGHCAAQARPERQMDGLGKRFAFSRPSSGVNGAGQNAGG